MIMKFSLSWIVKIGGSIEGGKKVDPAWEDVVLWLDRVCAFSGSVTLDVTQVPKVGLQTLQLISEKGNHVLTLGEDDGEEYNVRTYTNPFATMRFLDVQGENWSDSMICTEVDFVKKVFDEFFLSGDVSRELLS